MAFDAGYLERLRAGDAEAERHFVTYFSKVIRLTLRYRVRPDLIDDIRQETFLRVLNFLRSDKSINHPERLGAYVHSVSINVMMELVRASTRHPSIEKELRQQPDFTSSAEKAVLARERKERVERVLSGLDRKDQQILRAIFLEDAEKSEICDRFQVNRDYLRVLVHRAKVRFRQAVEKGGAA